MGAVGRGVGVALVVGLGLVGCGSNDNDQGISFRAVGIFQGEQQEDQCQVPVVDNAIGDPGISVPLNSPLVDGGYPDSNSFLSFCRGFLQLENNLGFQRTQDGNVVEQEGEAINVERIDFEYEIPGARIAIPSNSMPTGFRINPFFGPENSFGRPNTIFVQLDGQLVPSALVQFLRQNQPSLPQLPYVMIIHIRVRGRTDSGELLVSNEIRYTVEWLPGDDAL